MCLRGHKSMSRILRTKKAKKGKENRNFRTSTLTPTRKIPKRHKRFHIMPGGGFADTGQVSAKFTAFNAQQMAKRMAEVDAEDRLFEQKEKQRKARELKREKELLEKRARRYEATRAVRQETRITPLSL